MKKTPTQSFNKTPLCPPTCQIIKVLTLTLILIGLLLPQAKSQTPTLVLSNKWTISSANRTDVAIGRRDRSEEHKSELQSLTNIVFSLMLIKKKINHIQ